MSAIVRWHKNMTLSRTDAASKVLGKEVQSMKRIMLLLLAAALAPGLAELNAAVYTEGRVASMHSVPCGFQGRGHHRTAQMDCEQYVVQTDTMSYRIRQEIPKKVNLLPVGQEIYFRVKKNRMLVRGYTLNGKKIKDQEYVVISENQRMSTEAPGAP